jgi:putative AlgH/UPF0301 family transcriptional regulator
MPRLAVLAALFALVPCMAQVADLAPGKFLVAGRELGDPNFAEAVVLLVRYDEEQGAMGLIINRRTDVPISRLLHELKGAKGRTDLAYIGGPVEPGDVLALLKTNAKSEESQRIFGDVQLVSTKSLLEKILAGRAESNTFHVYLGYAGWGAGQLEHEVELGAWHVVPPDAAMVFDADPDSVWQRLVRRTELRIARLGRWGGRLLARSRLIHANIVDRHLLRKNCSVVG